MQSLSELNIKTTPREPQAKRQTSPVACAVFIAVLALAVTGGTLWLTSVVVNSNAQAAAMILSYE
jgi:low temperature requirement protein LtrA